MNINIELEESDVKNIISVLELTSQKIGISRAGEFMELHKIAIKLDGQLTKENDEETKEEGDDAAEES